MRLAGEGMSDEARSRWIHLTARPAGLPRGITVGPEVPSLTDPAPRILTAVARDV